MKSKSPDGEQPCQSPALPKSMVIGTWKIVRAEVLPGDSPAERFLHFSPGDLHFWEHPFLEGNWPKVCEFRYQMTKRGVHVTPNNQARGWEVPISVEGDCLLFKRSDANGERRWWLRRMLKHEQPDYLTCYYEPPAG